MKTQKQHPRRIPPTLGNCRVCARQPLTSSVWGQTDHAIRVSRRVEEGTTMINTAAVQGLDVSFPLGGVKQCGSGRHYGAEGLMGYVETPVINVSKMLDLP
ncbi:aldehyde dehydrogenase family protein [Sulfobacillus harzensis]|uniref:aldehyde dehydrogenase family protein n=1 Tax=Sulfobacillus harzensis TaxID=2729629 RepID=UPI001A9AEC8D